jgi:hypothetical protein
MSICRKTALQDLAPKNMSRPNVSRGVGSNDIQFMVEKLNTSLGMNLTMVSFDELSRNPRQLLALLNKLLAHLSDKMNVDIEKEPPQQTADRIREFCVRILGMKHLKDNMYEVSNGLQVGDRLIIYPIMLFILQKLSDLKTRVYLSNYLVEIKIPEEFFQFDDVRELHAQYKQLVQEFIQTHQATSKLREQVTSPDELKRAIESMTKEKEQLRVKIADQYKKLADMHVSIFSINIKLDSLNPKN